MGSTTWTLWEIVPMPKEHSHVRGQDTKVLVGTCWLVSSLRPASGTGDTDRCLVRVPRSAMILGVHLGSPLSLLSCGLGGDLPAAPRIHCVTRPRGPRGAAQSPSVHRDME